MAPIGRVLGIAAVLLLLGLGALRPVAAQVPTASVTIRVGILRDQDRVSITSDRPIDVTSGALRSTLAPGAYEFTAAAGGIEVGSGGRLDPVVRLLPTGGARLLVGIRPYRGVIELRRTAAGRLTVINELDLETYLYGVLKMEVDPRWPAEALKAQAVAARTLALYSLNRYAAEGYDVRATTDTQVYGGVIAEDPRATAAVDDTRGIVMLSGGRPVFSAFHSDSGGYTESSEFVWGGRYAYLRGVPDPYTAGAAWMVRLDFPALEDLLRRAGRIIGGIAGIDVGDLSPSGRVLTMHVSTSTGVVDVKGTDLRAIVGAERMKSTLFTVRVIAGDPPIAEFSGRGNGHGVGMSQWGARGQALLGRSYLEILRYYYTGVTLETR
ncbi:MAG TPA: SpoIID/LytB domain-containing protein [bacterium]